MSSAVQRRYRRLASATAISVVLAAFSTGAAVASTAQGTAALSGTSPSYATAATDQGQTAAATQLSIRVLLAGRNPSGLAEYAKDVSDPSNSLYGHYLSADAARQDFGATPQQISAVTSWLTSAGFSITSTNEHWIDVKGPAADVPKAFADRKSVV